MDVNSDNESDTDKEGVEREEDIENASVDGPAWPYDDDSDDCDDGNIFDKFFNIDANDANDKDDDDDDYI